MGIQNSSIATYGRLLPGLTNLTGHIRYYSLYCWLLSEYDKLEQNGEFEIHQYNFIRRSELAIALMMKGLDVRSVVGALFVSQKKCKLTEEGFYDIASGADFESKEKYWTFKSGAFGQYYLGSMIYYDLVKIEEGRFYLRNKGKELSLAVRNSIDSRVRDLFVKCIQEGIISEDDIKELMPLALNKIEIGTDEWRYLNQMLTMKDKDGSSLRRETVFLFLKDIEKGVSVNEFPKYRFNNVLEEQNISASFGWYFYYLCEVLHYCIETIFCLILNEIFELHNPSISFLSKQLQQQILEHLQEEQLYDSISEWGNELSAHISDKYDELKKLVNDRMYAKAAANAIGLLLVLQNEYYKESKVIKQFEIENELIGQRCVFSSGIDTYVTRHISLSIPKYIETIILQVMQEHTYIAIRKMGNSNMDLRKFIFEDGRVILVERRTPTETTPRVNSLYNFLQDLGYIDLHNQLTDIAHNYIQNYGKE